MISNKWVSLGFVQSLILGFFRVSFFVFSGFQFRVSLRISICHLGFFDGFCRVSVKGFIEVFFWSVV